LLRGFFLKKNPRSRLSRVHSISEKAVKYSASSLSLLAPCF
jgi:hypothetical protein